MLKERLKTFILKFTTTNLSGEAKKNDALFRWDQIKHLDLHAKWYGGQKANTAYHIEAIFAMVTHESGNIMHHSSPERDTGHSWCYRLS